MTRITTIVNKKGGVGKTTTAHALAAGLTGRGFRPLLIDADPSGNLTYTLGIDARTGLYDVLRGMDIRKAIRHTPQGDILPSTEELDAADLEFTQQGREYLLQKALQAVQDDYTHIIIDSPPELHILTINALMAATDVIIPMQADIYSLQGLGRLYDTILKVQKRNKRLKAAGILLTRYQGRAILTRDLTEVIKDKAEQLHTIVYKTPIREGIAVKEAQTMQTDMFSSHARSNSVRDYAEFVTEYINQEKEGI